MTTCDKYKERIALLASDDLDALERGPTLEHLAKCASCRAEYDVIVRLCCGIRRIVQEDESAQLPAGLHERSVQRMLSETRQHRRTAWAAFAAAACILVGLAMWLCLRGGAGPEAPGTMAHKPI